MPPRTASRLDGTTSTFPKGLIVNYLKALIASDIIGRQAYYEVANTIDPAFNQAVTHLEQGDAAVPITAQGKVN